MPPMTNLTPERIHRRGPKWLWPDGTILPVIAGGDGSGDGGAAGNGGADGGAGEGDKGEGGKEGDGDAPDLGETGKKALASERARAREADKRAKAAERKALDAEERASKLEEANKSDHEKALDEATKKAREEASKEATTKANRRILTAEVKAAAGNKLSDPSDAVRLLDLDEFTVSDDGEVDEKEIAEAIDELLKEKPYLAAKNGKPTGSADGGARGGGGGGDEKIAPGMGRLRKAYQDLSK